MDWLNNIPRIPIGDAIDYAITLFSDNFSFLTKAFSDVVESGIAILIQGHARAEAEHRLGGAVGREADHGHLRLARRRRRCCCRDLETHGVAIVEAALQKGMDVRRAEEVYARRIGPEDAAAVLGPQERGARIQEQRSRFGERRQVQVSVTLSNHPATTHGRDIGSVLALHG